MPSDGMTLSELATRLDARLEGDGAVVVRRVGSLAHAGPDAVTFLGNARLRDVAAATAAAAVIVAPEDVAAVSRARLVHANPYAAFAQATALLHPEPVATPGVHSTASVDPAAHVDPSASVGPCAVVAAGAHVGAGAVLGPHCAVGAGARVEAGARLGPHVSVYHGCVIGPRTIVHAGAVIGADGFGMAEADGRWVKVPQVGRVTIGADCEVGANTTIDRGTIDDTVIEDDVKLDNQIQIGHNCRIGAHTAIAGCTGIAGSATIGRHVRIGGAAMIAGHLSIPDRTVIAAGSTVLNTIREPGFYNSSPPLMPLTEWRYVAAGVRRLRKLMARVSALEKRVPGPGPSEESP